jgi:hypothetical protein
MADAPETQSLADYVRQENAKEREAAGLDGEGAPLPAAEPLSASEAAEASDAEIADPAHSDAPAEITAERNADGTFKPVKRDKVQERIDKAVKAQRDAERRAEASEARARELEAKSTSAPSSVSSSVSAPSASDEPKIDDFLNEPDPYAALIRAHGTWAATRALAEHDARLAIQAIAAQSDQDGRAQFPDWDEVINSDFARTFDVPPHLLAAIRTSDQSAALRYYLASHPDDARALAADPPVKALVALGTLAAHLDSASHGSERRMVTHSQAKPPTKPLRGSTPSAPSATAPDPATTKLSDWIRINNALDRRRMQESRGA